LSITQKAVLPSARRWSSCRRRMRQPGTRSIRRGGSVIAASGQASSPAPSGRLLPGLESARALTLPTLIVAVLAIRHLALVLLPSLARMVALPGSTLGFDRCLAPCPPPLRHLAVVVAQQPIVFRAGAARTFAHPYVPPAPLLLASIGGVFLFLFRTR